MAEVVGKNKPNRDNLFFKACVLNMAIEGIVNTNKYAAIPEYWQTAITTYAYEFLKDLELFIYDEPFWSNMENNQQEEVSK